MRLLLAISLFFGCASTHTTPAPEVAPAPRRDACLASPWVPTGDTVATLSHRACGERGHLLVREGDRPPTDEEVSAIRRHFTPEAGLGVCCPTDSLDDGLCVRIRMTLCERQLDALAGELAVAASGAAGARVKFFVELEGLAGPRCGPDDPQCLPVAYGGAGGELDRDSDRTPVDRTFGARYARLSSGVCAYDGECQPAGCGNQCARWTDAHGAGTCEAYPDMEDAPAFCGCVEGHCQWFTQ